MFLLFLGIILIINGIYEQKFQSLKKNVKIEYRFIPRTYYEEQLSQNADVTSNYKNMFQALIKKIFRVLILTSNNLSEKITKLVFLVN